MSDDQALQSGDIICRLFNITAAELKRLVDNSIIPKAGRDQYSLIAVVRAYVEHLRGGDDKPALQTEIAAHLGMSDRNLRDVLQNLKLDHRTRSLREIRLMYIEDLRGKAAGHRSEDGFDIVHERVLTERIDRQLKEIQLAEKLGEFVVAADVAAMVEQMVVAFRADMLSLGDNLKTIIDATHGVDVDIELINEPINETLQRLSSFEADSGEDNHTGRAESSATTEDDDYGVVEQI